MRLLLVEDDSMIGAAAQQGLRHEGHTVDWVRDGHEAEGVVKTGAYDLVLLDLGLPRKDGFSVLEGLRRRKNRLPVLVITARDSIADRVKGLDHGADDYVVKPFSPKELVARVRAVLRRADAKPMSDERIEAGDLELDLARRRVTAAGRRVDLTPTEFELHATLAREPGRVWTRSQLLDSIHGFSLETYERAIDGHIRNLRRKLEPDDAAGTPRYVRTVHGVGYALAEPEG